MNDKEEKRVLEGYEERHAVQIGYTELIIAENKDVELSYMLCDCTRNNVFGIEEYSNAQVSADYVEVLRKFVSRADALVKGLEMEREVNGLPLQVLGAAHCIPGSDRSHYADKVVVIKAECLLPEFRSAEHQLLLCRTGNGCNPHARGRAVFADNLFSEKPARWERENIEGVIDPAYLPEWAQEKLAKWQGPKIRLSMRDQLKAGKQKTAEQPEKPKSKDEPSL